LGKVLTIGKWVSYLVRIVKKTKTKEIKVMTNSKLETIATTLMASLLSSGQFFSTPQEAAKTAVDMANALIAKLDGLTPKIEGDVDIFIRLLNENPNSQGLIENNSNLTPSQIFRQRLMKSAQEMGVDPSNLGRINICVDFDDDLAEYRNQINSHEFVLAVYDNPDYDHLTKDGSEVRVKVNLSSEQTGHPLILAPTVQELFHDWTIDQIFKYLEQSKNDDLLELLAEYKTGKMDRWDFRYQIAKILEI
jgi:hypothetical protein